MDKKEVLGAFLQLIIVLGAIALMYFGGWRFFTISGVFFIMGAGAEFIFYKKFYAKEKKIKKESLKRGLLWVHANISYIKKYGTKIYDFSKLGLLPMIIAYLTMFVYILIAFILFNLFGDYGFIIYLIPIFTNIYSFYNHFYMVLSY